MYHWMVILSLLKFSIFFPFINQVDKYTVFIAESLTNGNCFFKKFFLWKGHVFF